MENILRKLKDSGYKLTRPRLAIIDCLNGIKHPASARTIHEKINRFDQASVYRAIKLFESLGIVMAEAVGAEKYYCLSSNPHHHIICRQCGHIENFPCTHQFNKYKNFTDIEHQLTLHGVCGKCSK